LKGEGTRRNHSRHSQYGTTCTRVESENRVVCFFDVETILNRTVHFRCEPALKVLMRCQINALRKRVREPIIEHSKPNAVTSFNHKTTVGTLWRNDITYRISRFMELRFDLVPEIDHI
jgi:hypothetical protein